MGNLLSANLLRLRKNVLFWGLLAVSFGFGCFLVYTQLSDRAKYGDQIQLDSILFFYTMCIGLFSAVFISLFFGTEYSDGAVRNKVTVGLGRVPIYFANLLTGFAVSLCSCAASLLAVLGLGLPTMGAPNAPLGAIVLNLLGSVLMVAAFCAIYTAVTMNCAKKAAAAVCCILLFFGMMIASTYVKAMLDAPEFITGFELGANGEIVQSQPEPNPRYLREAQRAVYEFAYDAIPTGQASQYTTMAVPHPARAAVLALAETAAFTAAGAALFQRKDLK